MNHYSDIKVLLVKDDMEGAQLVRALTADTSESAALTSKVELLHADRLKIALAYLAEMTFDVALIDLALPDFKGISAFAQIQNASPGLPIVILSEPDDIETAIQTMQQGAQDCLVKGQFDSNGLRRALRNAVAYNRLALEMEQKTRALQAIEAKPRIAVDGNKDGVINELTHKMAQLEARNAELDSFAQTTAHQIQGLLSQMIGYTSYLEMHYSSALDEEAQDVMKRVLRSGAKMSNILNELLLLAYVDEEDIPITPLNMRRIIAEARKRLAFQIEEYQGRLILPDSWPIVLGYGSWIEEVWVNYIGNGLKYGGDSPHLELGVDEESDSMARFWVKDNGQGIAPADQEKLFKPHTRLRQMRAKGEGLGLSIVRRIVKKCGGDVGVDSAPGEGSTFWFTLSIACDDDIKE